MKESNQSNEIKENEIISLENIKTVIKQIILNQFPEKNHFGMNSIIQEDLQIEFEENKESDCLIIESFIEAN